MNQLKKSIGNTLKIFFSNLDTLILFQVFYQMLYYLLYSIFTFFFRFALQHADMPYVSNEFLLSFLKNPATILFLLVLVILLGLYVYIQCAALMIYFEAGRTHKRLHFLSFTKETFKTIGLLKKPSQWLILLYLLLLTLFLVLPANKTLFGITIPEFIRDVIYGNKVMFLLYTVLSIFVFFFFLVYAFTLYQFFIQKKPFRQAAKESKEIVKKHFIKMALRVFVWNLVFTIVLYAISFLFLLIFYLIIRFAFSDMSSFWFLFKRFEAIYRFLSPILFVNVNLLFVNALFTKEETKQATKEKKKKWKRHVLKVLAILFLLMVSVEFVDPSLYQNYDFSQTKIIAHRAGGSFAPENSISGLQEAIDNHSDYAEIDVQLTKDGILVLSHDASLKRIAQHDNLISDMTYEELKDIDIGSSFRKDFKGETIPTLKEALQFAKGKIKVIIELKKGNNTKEMVSKTIEIIQECGMEDEVSIASMQIDVLKEVKKIDESLSTTYLVMLAYGNLLAVQDDVDIFAFEPSYVNESTLFDLHDKGKKVFVWTINEEKNLYKILTLPLDGIITDNPYLARYVVDTHGNHPIIEFLRTLF